MLHAINRPPETVPRSRCAPSTRPGMAEGKEVPGYLEEEGVPEDSRTETYVALRLEVDNWRWAGVPIYLRTGKRLARKVTEIAVTLKPVPAPGLRGGGLGRRAAQPARADRAAERGRVAVARGEDPRHAHADPPGEHGVPLRHRVPVAVARGLRAADPRRDARRRHAVHPRRRGGGAVARSSTRSSRRGARRGRPAADVPRRLRADPRRPTSCSWTATRGARSDGAGSCRASGASRTRPRRDRGGAPRELLHRAVRTRTTPTRRRAC